MKYSEIIKLNSDLKDSLDGSHYNVFIASNIMVHQSKEICEFSLRRESVNASVSIGRYDNIVQDSSKVKNVDAVLIFWEVFNFVDGLHYKIDTLTEVEFQNLIQKVKLEIDLVFSNLKNVPLVLINKFSTLVFNQFNLSDNRISQLAKILNLYLANTAKENTKIVDIDKVISRLSIDLSIDLRYYYSSKTLYSIKFYRQYFEYIKPFFLSTVGKAKKALIFDCDNTLWKGVLGEDGPDGIKVYQEIQYLALSLESQGVIIGLCSKNNLEDVDEVLKHHTDMILRDENIAIKKVNWGNKVDNLRSIANDLNIGLDSLVFFDDSSFEVELVARELPDVKVFQVPPKEYEYGQLFREVFNLFYSPVRTKEDKSKSKMYKDQSKRLEEKESSKNIEDYLISLGIVIEVYEDNLSHAPRIAQLTQKTNQFNLTTKRYTESDIKAFIQGCDKIVLSIEVFDKFGPSGLTGVAILCKKTCEIDSLLLSCRVLGRNIEYKFMEIIISIAKKNELKVLRGNYVKTYKNSQVENFYDKCGFNIKDRTDKNSIYSIDVDEFNRDSIDYIKVNHGR